MEYEPGTRIGHVVIERELGRGAFGTVYLGRDALIDRPVALKVIRGAGVEVDQEKRDLVLAEARIIAGLSNPHIVTLYSLQETPDGDWAQEMELVGGGALEDRLGDGAALSPDEAIRVMRGVLTALAAAHAARIVHGDVKPGNVLFDEDGTVKLADFGTAKIVEQVGASVPLHGAMVGTPLFMAPEVITGDETGPAADIWSAGVLFYQLLSGRLPFPATSFMELAGKVLADDPEPLPDLPSAVANALCHCLQKKPADRPTAEEVLSQLPAAGAAAAALLTNAEPPSTSFVDREDEIAAIEKLLSADRVRLITVTGPPGIGKSRLGLQVAEALLGRYPGGAAFVDLSGVEGPEGVMRAVNDTLCGALLHRRSTLVVLDGFEPHLASAPGTVGRWVKEAPRASFLVLSGATLQLAGERRFDLGPLAVPAGGASPEEIRGSAAVRLFLSRAEEADEGFTANAAALGLVADIVRRLEGIPLAIEAAAEIAVRDGLVSLAGNVTGPLAACLPRIEVLYGHLSEQEKDALLQASCFRGGFTIDAAEEVMDLSHHPDDPFAFDVVQALRDKSFLTGVDEEGETRFSMYGPLREFARRRWSLEADEERRAALSARHAGYYLALPANGVESENAAAAREWTARSGGGDPHTSM